MAKKNKRSNGFMRGIIAMITSQVIIKIVGLVYKIYLTNREGFGDSGNAINGAGFQIYALLLTISSIGVPNAISKLVSERLAIGDNKGAHRVFKIGFALFASIGLIGTLLLFFGAKHIAVIWLQIPEAELTLVSLSPSIFFVSIASVIRGYCNGRENLNVTAKSQTLEQIFKSTLTIILVELVVMGSGMNITLMSAGANLATTFATFLGFRIFSFILYKDEERNMARCNIFKTISKRKNKNNCKKYNMYSFSNHINSSIVCNTQKYRFSNSSKIIKKLFK